jgi:23S rRNA maturation mini-RNase III
MGNDVLRQQRRRRVALALVLMLLRVERVSGWSSSHYYLTSPSVRRISSRSKWCAAADSSDDCPDNNVPLPCLIATTESNNVSARLSSPHTDTTVASLPPIFCNLRPNGSCDADRMSGTDLAYMGDVVYELFVRSRTVWPPQRTADRQDTAVALVRGRNYRALDGVWVLWGSLCVWPLLFQFIEIVSQFGYCSNSLYCYLMHCSLIIHAQHAIMCAAEHQSRLLSRMLETFDLTIQEQQVLKRGRNAASGRNHNRRDPVIYQDSTALEAILGYLYISNPDRCSALLQWMDTHIDQV